MAADGGDIGFGEIARTLNRLERAIAAVDAKVEGLSFVRQDVWSVEREAMHERIEQVRLVAEASTVDVHKELSARIDSVAVDLGGTKDNLRWLVRAVAGALIVIVVGAMVSGLHP